MIFINNCPEFFTSGTNPFDKDEFKPESLKENLRKLADTDITGDLVLGSNGELRSRSEAEELQALEVFAEEREDKVAMNMAGYHG